MSQGCSNTEASVPGRPRRGQCSVCLFSFSQFLQWSDQPIYVLDKDNDLNIAQLARQNASDIVKVQPEGPYLLGGHSYGGAVAMEVAMVLESWGHEIGAVMVRLSCMHTSLHVALRTDEHCDVFKTAGVLFAAPCPDCAGSQHALLVCL